MTHALRAELLSIGSELAIGQTVDTNSAYLARELAGLGILARRHVTVGDSLEEIAEAFAEAAGRSDVVLATGGLGPTLDDLTRQGLARAMGVGLVTCKRALSEITAYFASRNRPLRDSNRVQALLPEGALMVQNPAGTAPGMAARVGKAAVFCMPGVPREMKVIWSRTLAPVLSGGSFSEPQAHDAGVYRSLSEGLSAWCVRLDRPTVVWTVLQTIGLPESELGERIADLMDRSRNPQVGTTAKDGVIGVRINAAGANPQEARALLDADRAEVRQRLGLHVFGEGEQDTLAVGVVRGLLERDARVALAESCTGGWVAQMLTEVPGASGVLHEAVVCYSNEAKVARCGVPEGLIAEHGAVSEAVAVRLAEGVRGGCAYGLSITGIAGPEGGTADKPVGTVHFGLSRSGGPTVHEVRLMVGDRSQIRYRAACHGLDLLRRAMAGAV